MPVYLDTEQFYTSLKTLFARIEQANPAASDAILKSRLCIRFNCAQPEAILTINGRQSPLLIHYGSNNLKPDIAVDLTTDTLHRILLGETTVTKAMGRKELKPSGPIWKTKALSDLFYQAQTIYPQFLQEQSLGN